MKKVLIFVVLAVAGGALLILKPWEEPRYDATPLGKEAKKIDEHVAEALTWSKTDTFGHDQQEAEEFINNQPHKTSDFYSMFGEGKEEITARVQAIKASGAKKVFFINLDHSVRTGWSVEGMAIELPEGKGKRAKVFAVVGPMQKGYKGNAAVEKNQKYLYIGFQPEKWNPQKEDAGFLPS